MRGRLLYLVPAIVFGVIAGYLLWGLDPERDTPDVLKTHAQAFHIKPGWLFLTGGRRQTSRSCAGSWACISRRSRTAPITTT